MSLEASISEDRFCRKLLYWLIRLILRKRLSDLPHMWYKLKNTLVDENSIGRKVDFILQEMNREVNTIGSKAMDSSITEFVVQLKCELEKIREQVQNVE